MKSLSTAGAPNRPRYTLSWNGRVYFYEGSSCWQTDGTPVGTITFESYCSSSLAFAIGDGRLLYSKSVSGESEIWSIDSADVKTQETELSTYSSSPSGFTWLGATAFFSADDAVSGRELWVSDGTPEGTELIDLHSGPGASSPAQFTLFEDEIWFHATTPATGDELWHSDGSATGTQPYEIIPGSDSSYPSQMVVLGSSLFVVAYDDLLGEQLFRIADAGSPAVLLDFANESYLSPEELVAAGNRVYFFGSTAATGEELFSVDEDDLEPTPIEIVPEPASPMPSRSSWRGPARPISSPTTASPAGRSGAATASRPRG